MKPSKYQAADSLVGACLSLRIVSVQTSHTLKCAVGLGMHLSHAPAEQQPGVSVTIKAPAVVFTHVCALFLKIEHDWVSVT